METGIGLLSQKIVLVSDWCLCPPKNISYQIGFCSKPATNLLSYLSFSLNVKDYTKCMKVQCVTIEFRQGPICVVNYHFSRPPNRHKSSNSTKPFWPIFTISESFQMRYCMTLYLKGHQKYNK